MRKFLLSVAVLAAASVAATSPESASADAWRYHTPAYYQGYTNYTPNYIYAAPGVSSYYAGPNSYIDSNGQMYIRSGPAYQQTYPVGPAFGPIYSGPRYFQGYAPPRLIVYP